jgi:hypothetical protein
MIAARQFSVRKKRRVLEMDISLIFFCFGSVAAFAIHIDIALTEMQERIGIDMAIHARHLTLVVDILGPFIRIDVEGPGYPSTLDLRQVRLSMALEAVLIRKRRLFSKGVRDSEKQECGDNDAESFLAHAFKTISPHTAMTRCFSV